MTEYLDSLNSTPSGKAKYQEITRNSYLSGNIDKIPRRDGSYYVTRSVKDNKMRVYDTAGMEKYFYEDSPSELEWQTGDSTKNVLGYECLEATADYHGRKWRVWFTPEIPVFSGPWKLCGLSGLILEAETEGGQYKFVATGLQKSQKNISPVYLESEYEKISRKDFLMAKRTFMENPLGSIKATMRGVVTIKNADGSEINKSIFVPASKVDFIETDYH